MPRFDCFVIFADMRTGSNFLESNVNALQGLHCHGEAFNPSFVGYPDRQEMLGIDLAMRERDPFRLLRAIRDRPDTLGGFRFFNDHDPRIFDAVLPDPRVAKIVLTRNPLESYVSRKIAQATGQWKLTNVKHARPGQAIFDAEEFGDHLAALQDFQLRILRGLQRTGQAAFYLAYEDLQDVEVVNGLAAWLGCDARLDTLESGLKPQNPRSLQDKVANPAEMEQALAAFDRFDLTRTPVFEPRRQARVPSFCAAPRSPLLYMPVPSGPGRAVRAWMAALDDAGEAELQGGFSQKTLRRWMRERPGHRAFTVLRHPVARAHAAFCERLLVTGPGSFSAIRGILRRQFGVPLPEEAPGPGWGAAEHRAAFFGFLRFLKANLSGQTSVRVDPAWASQAQLLQGMAALAPPDVILREDELGRDLPRLAAAVGRPDAPPPQDATDPHRARLAEIHDADLEAAARDVYNRDYLVFGFGPWT